MTDTAPAEPDDEPTPYPELVRQSLHEERITHLNEFIDWIRNRGGHVTVPDTDLTIDSTEEADRLVNLHLGLDHDKIVAETARLIESYNNL